jgi:hypothetical protein
MLLPTTEETGFLLLLRLTVGWWGAAGECRLLVGCLRGVVAAQMAAQAPSPAAPGGSQHTTDNTHSRLFGMNSRHGLCGSECLLCADIPLLQSAHQVIDGLHLVTSGLQCSSTQAGRCRSSVHSPTLKPRPLTQPKYLHLTHA